jgi:uncharacterized protein with NRDE domain
MCILYIVAPSQGNSSSGEATATSSIPLIIANNRDEYVIRPAAKGSFHPISPSNNEASVYYPVDLKAGGSWLCFDHGNRFVSKNASGDPNIEYRGAGPSFRFALVLNFDEFRIGYTADRSKKYVSRGFLCKQFIEGNLNALDYCLQLLSQIDEFRGFNFIVGDDVSGTYFLSNIDCPGSRIADGNASTSNVNFDRVSSDLNKAGNLIKLRPGVLYGVANGSFDDDSWPKIQIGKERIRSAISSFEPAVSSRTSAATAAGAGSDGSTGTDGIVAVDAKRTDSHSIASSLLATPSPSLAVVDSKPSINDQSVGCVNNSNIVSIAQAILGTVLSDRTEHDDPLFEAMSSDLARSLMSICIQPVYANPADEPGCFVKDVEYDSLNALRNALRAELLRDLPSDVLPSALTPPGDAAAGDDDESASESKQNGEVTGAGAGTGVGTEEADNSNANDFMFATRNSTVIVLNPYTQAERGQLAGVIVETDHVESSELKTTQRFDIVCI